MELLRSLNSTLYRYRRGFTAKDAMRERVLPQLTAFHQLRKLVRSLPVRRGHDLVWTMVGGHLFQPYKYTPEHTLHLRLFHPQFDAYEFKEKRWEKFLSRGYNFNLKVFRHLARCCTLHLYSHYISDIYERDEPVVFRYSRAYKNDRSPIREDEKLDCAIELDELIAEWEADNEGWETDD